MKIVNTSMKNFRGIKDGTLMFDGHSVLVGDNNCGKSSVLEAIDLVLGPERLSRKPVIDEHDFYAGQYFDDKKEPIKIEVEVTISDLGEEQKRYFRDHLEWWDNKQCKLLEQGPPEATDQDHVAAALRVHFVGNYNAEEDDFEGSTFYSSPQKEDNSFEPFRLSDKRQCGFLFLRTLRTGSRALSLERGSLLDIILKLQDKRLTMWEDVLDQLRVLKVAERPDLGIVDILSSVHDALGELVPSDWGDKPHMRVSDLTREMLRKTLTVFMGTGAKKTDGSEYAAPFQHQGTGTINTLVLVLLSIIAELKQNVIFAMEEPEIGIPPHIQRRVVSSVMSKSAQGLFTSHSPYVLEMFDPTRIIAVSRKDGILSGAPAGFPPTVKAKKYREEMRRRICEALLSRRVMVAEGRTEYDALPAACDRLSSLEPSRFRYMGSLGIALVDAEADSQVVPMAKYFSSLGKQVFAFYDKQANSDYSNELAKLGVINFESPYSNFEDLIIEQSTEVALRRFAAEVVQTGEWPPHLNAHKPTPQHQFADIKQALKGYFAHTKGEGSAAKFLEQCSLAEMPEHLVAMIEKLNEEPPVTSTQKDEGAGTPA